MYNIRKFKVWIILELFFMSQRLQHDKLRMHSCIIGSFRRKAGCKQSSADSKHENISRCNNKRHREQTFRSRIRLYFFSQLQQKEFRSHQFQFRVYHPCPPLYKCPASCKNLLRKIDIICTKKYLLKKYGSTYIETQ